MKRGCLVFFLWIISFHLKAQQADTLIYAQGNIVSAITKEAVVARISYQSLPYGNKLGVLSGNTFSFPLFDGNKYAITVEAPGFAPSKFILDPAEANAERKVIKNIELNLPVSATAAAESTHTEGKVLRLEHLIFNLGTSKITPESYPELDKILNMLNANPSMIIQLEGHTDAVGDAKLNMSLSQNRVAAVKDYLVKKGIPKNRIKTKAFGGTQPISRENTEEAHRMNRRVEVRILKN